MILVKCLYGIRFVFLIFFVFFIVKYSGKLREKEYLGIVIYFNREIFFDNIVYISLLLLFNEYFNKRFLICLDFGFWNVNIGC